ncbi:hypothetical protein SAY86_026160 [Trapa natans]|uniref:Uncharacterized protein n=1 Tax=Trapa natans TaxID=22666 RepID=A0AAN7KL73_TRANT|nr:hypothetical protein SAY86_026160 [Trapa natans]
MGTTVSPMEIEPPESVVPPPAKFALPVDSEHMATEFRFFSIAKPHMSAFHLSWVSFFTCFVSSFAAPPLIPIIRDDLNLTATDIGNAGIASVSGAVFARLALGAACDVFGPRLASSSLIILTAPAVYFTSIASSPVSFLLVRFFAGFSLATFVSSQFWTSCMFSANLVGTANGLSGGWGNLGGGATQLIMPFVFSVIRDIGAVKFTAWRIAFFIPALLQTVTAFAVLLCGQDLPDGNLQRLHKEGDKPKEDFSKVFYHGISNYRGWILALTYGYCFGVELTVDNIIAEYFYDRFDLKLSTAGIIAATFGLANLFSRPLGGVLSDVVAKRFGMRGRLWTLWTVQTIGGILCVILGRMGSLGVISGMTGGGGNVGAVVTQLIFFKGSRYSKETGITLMGIMIICCTLPICLVYFPQWGGMLCGPSSNKSFAEEDYYLSEWNSLEKDIGFHHGSMKFAFNSRSERGKRSVISTTPAAYITPSIQV